MLRWCERYRIDYIVGLAKNSRLLALAADWMKSAEEQYQSTREKQRFVGSSRLRGRQLGPRAPRHRQGRAQRAGGQPALCCHQPYGRGSRALRGDLLRPRRDGKLRSKDSSSGSLPIAPVATLGGPTSSGSCSPRRPACSWRRSGASDFPAPSFAKPAQSAQARHGHLAQYAAHPAAVFERLSASGTLRHTAGATQFGVRR